MKQRNLALKPGMALMLVEGADAYHFFIEACSAYGVDSSIQVIDFHGITELGSFLSTLRLMPDFDKVPAILIVRDAETDSTAAIQAIKSALTNNGFVAPAEPDQWKEGIPAIKYLILPGTIHNGKYDNGALEDLCIQTLDEDGILDLADKYLDDVETVQHLTHRHKSRLHAYLAGKNKFVGKTIGQAAKAGAWNWQHEVMQVFRMAMEELHSRAEGNS